VERDTYLNTWNHKASLTVPRTAPVKKSPPRISIDGEMQTPTKIQYSKPALEAYFSKVDGLLEYKANPGPWQKQHSK
jgi:hypothetical protein